MYTSRNGSIWDQDAKYYYYPHGPLARTELGEYKVQGSDYAYTLQGWLKGVNSEALQPANDMGLDGFDLLANTSTSVSSLHRFNARDGFGFGINYYSDGTASDYLPVNGANTGATYFLATLNTGSYYSAPALFNGNISHLSTAYLNPGPSVNLVNALSYTTVNQYGAKRNKACS